MMFVVVATVSLFLSAIVLAVSAFIAKRHALADLRKLPGPKPSVWFGNALQLGSEADGKLGKLIRLIGKACVLGKLNKHRSLTLW